MKGANKKGKINNKVMKKDKALGKHLPIYVLIKMKTKKQNL